ncbi:hypothetical protein KFE98_07490 [bacterium SCSIO 12741]|nr:hypothetical protein KFE98_07490 [bacterium SCSIO 12741]
MARIPKFPKLKKRYWIILTGAILILCAALILPLQRVFHHYTDQLVREILTDMVDEQTQGKYHLRYKKLRFNIFTQTLRLYDFHYYPKDTTSLVDFDTSLVKNQFHYGISVEELELKLDREWEIFLNNQLDIKSATIKQPTIKVLNKRVKKTEIKIAKMSGDLYRVVTQYLNVFKLRDVAVEDAKMAYYLQTKDFHKVFRFNSFSFRIRDFEVSENIMDEDEKLMFTEDFELNSKGQTFLLPDSIHQMSFSRFFLSTTDRKLEFYNFKIEPVVDSLPDSIRQINLYVPEFKLDKIDFVQAYLENVVEVNELLINRPALKIQLTQTPKDTTAQDSLTEKTARMVVNTLLKNTLEELVIHRLKLEDGTVALDHKAKGQEKNYLFKGIDLQVTELMLDSQLFNAPDLSKIQRNIRVGIDEFHYEIPQENYHVKTGSLNYSSITKVLSCNAFEIKPGNNQNRKLMARRVTPVLLDSLFIGNLQVDNLNIRDIGRKDKIQLNRIKLDQPWVRMAIDTSFFNLPDSVRKKRRPSTEFLPIDTLLCRMLQVDRGKLEVRNARVPSEKFGELNKLNLWLEDLSLNDFLSNQVKPEYWLQKTSLDAGKAELTIPGVIEGLSWGQVGYDKNKEQFYTYGLQYAVEDKYRSLNLNFPEVQIKVENPAGLLRDSTKKFGSIRLVEPRLEIRDSIRQKKSGSLELPFLALSTDSLEVIDGYYKRTYRNRVEQFIKGVDIESGVTQFAKEDGKPLDWSIHNLGISFDQSNILIDNRRHRLRTGRCTYSKQDSLFYLDNIRINPLRGIRGDSSHPLVKARIGYANFETLFAGTNTALDTIQSGEIHFCEADLEVDLFTGGKAQGGKNLFELHQWLEDVTGIERLSYDALSLENANLKARIHSQKDPKKNWLLTIDQYDITSQGFEVNRNINHSDKNLFYAKDFTMRAYGIQQVFPDSTDYLNLDELFYSTENHYLKLSNTRFGYLVKDGKSGERRFYVETTVPGLEMEGLRLYEARKNGRLKLDRLHLTNPILDITQFHRNSETVSRELDVDRGFEQDSLAVDKLLLQELKLEKGFITWHFDDTTRDAIRINHLHVDGNDLALDPSGESKLPQFDALKISFGDFRHDVLKDYFNLHLDSFNLNTRSEELLLEGIRLDPNYGIFEFGQVAGWEKSRLEMYLNRVKVSGLQTKKLLYDQEFRAELVSADSLWIRNFKDKRLGMIERNMALPVPGLQRLPLTVQVDSAELKGGVVTHMQLSKNGVKPGKIILTDLKGTVSNITNDPKLIEKNGTMQAVASTKLMGEGLIEAVIRFDLSDSMGTYTTDATIGAFDATSLNPFTEHTAFIRIKSGQVNESEASFRSNDEYSIGNMRLLYENLHVEFLNRKNPEHKGMGLAMKSFLANQIVNTKNPHLFITKKGDIYYVRDTTRVIFDYLTKSAMSGVVSSVGVRSNRKYIRKVKKEQLRRERAIRRREDEEEEESGEASPTTPE